MVKYSVKHPVKYADARLDTLFAALSDPTRRGIVAMLAAGGRPVSELAQPYAISLPGFLKHLRILEQAGLVEREKSGRVVQCTLNADPMKDAADWLERHSAFWNERLDALGRFLDKENPECPPVPQSPQHRPSPSSASTRRPRKKSGGH